MHTYSFEKLEAWHKAQQLTFDIYKITEAFPRSEMFGLTNQLRRCAVSVSSNIAEGSGRSTANDKARFTTIAYGSLMEVLNQILIANGLNYITNDRLNTMREKIEELGKLLTGLKKAQLNSSPAIFQKLKSIFGFFKIVSSI